MAPAAARQRGTPPRAPKSAPQGESEAPSQPARRDPHLLELGDTVALLPWSYKNGREAALQSGREVCNQILLETGFNVFLTKTVTGAMPPAMPNDASGKKAPAPFAHLMEDSRALVGQTVSDRTNGSYILPTVDQMVAIGERLKTRYVLAGRAQWSRRNVWVGVSNRAKAMCIVDVQVVDVANKKLVLDARNVEGDSTENKNMFNTVTSMITLNPLPLLFPGSATPQEQRAVTVATAKALEPWLRPQRIHAALAQADLSSELASDSTVKFSSLVSPVTSVQATLKLSDVDEKQLGAIDPDVAKLFEDRTVNLDYKEPNSLRLRATTAKGEQAALVVDEDTRRYSSAEKDKGSPQDIANSPSRRISLLDFCGLITPGLLDNMRARYVTDDTIGPIHAAVYDLSYWRADDVSYQRVWIDPATRIVAKREVFDHNSKLKSVFLYHEPKEVATGISLPSRVEIQNPLRKRIATITIVDSAADVAAPDGSPTNSRVPRSGI
jgi:hypothetical protein